MPFQDTDEDTYGVSGTIHVPVWYHNCVSALLGALGVFGIFLNGFVICCFILHPIVSTHFACTQQPLPCKIDNKDKVKFMHRQIFLFKKIQIRTPYNYLLINLALAELVIASVGVTFDLNSLLNHGWSFGVNVCNVSGLIVTTSGMKFFEIHFLCAASVNII